MVCKKCLNDFKGSPLDVRCPTCQDAFNKASEGYGEFDPTRNGKVTSHAGASIGSQWKVNSGHDGIRDAE